MPGLLSKQGKKRISRTIAQHHTNDMTIHDDGIAHHGGVTICAIGPMGSGKTTLGLTTAIRMMHVVGGHSKEAAIHRTVPVMPETVIWRGRKFDYWNTLLPGWMKREFPEEMPKIYRAVYIHTHADDDLSFTYRTDAVYEYIQEDPDPANIDEPHFRKYSDIDSLYKNIVPGAINVVYEPNLYFLTPTVTRKLREKLYTEIKTARMSSSSTKRRGAYVRMSDQPVPAPSPIWWFEFLERLLELKAQDDFYSIFLDESHQIFPASVSSVHWHLCEWFANTVIDTRRKNVSIFMVTHAAQLVDYRVIDRTQFFIWLRGSAPTRRLSMITRYLTGILDKGEAIIEAPNISFGLMTFDKIPQALVIQVEGLDTPPVIDEGEEDAGEMCEAGLAYD